jgi:hypothetical protein
MKLLDSMSPERIAALSGAGSVIVLLTIAKDFLIPRPHLPGPSLAFWAAWAAVVVGYALMWAMERRLVDGIEAGRWSEDELEPLRRRLAHPAWTFVSWALLLAAVLTFPISRWATYWLLFCIWVLASGLVARLRFALKPADDSSARGGLAIAAPISSEHWGQRS